MKGYRSIIDGVVEGRLDRYWDVALDLFAHPQVGYEEVYASGVCRALLAEEGFEVCIPMESLPTSFLGTFSTGEGPTVGILCEYDSLPELGHACGHPVIAVAGVLAGSAVKKAMEELDVKGTVKVFGTPAEEVGGGKIVMLNGGVFDGCDAVLLCHPSSLMTRVAGNCCSSQGAQVVFTGKPAQAESHPDQGKNALDAVALTQAAIGMARQQLFDDIHIASVVHEIANALTSIPDHAVMEFGVSTTGPDSHLRRGLDVVERAVRGAAIATDCEYEYTEQTENIYLGRLENETIGSILRDELRDAGEPTQDGLPMDSGREDFGNITRVIPGVQVYAALTLERKVSGHTQEFKELAMSPAGKHVADVCAKGMARTAYVLLTSPETCEAAKAEMAERLKEKQG
ncbi:MAG: M20/M25/M40 family metallo-hydrolase [Atopobiaceae bacterium]|nr:M20/M25/M40 family metallo-hydrolase [Atopobiaceae bacterium]